MKHLPSNWREFDGESDLLESSDEPAGGFLSVRAIEVGGAEVLPVGLVSQHVPGGGEHRSGHGDDGFHTGSKHQEQTDLFAVRRLPITPRFHASRVRRSTVEQLT